MKKSSIWRQKSVVTALVNCVVIAVGLLAGRFMKPEDFDLLKTLWLQAFQPLVLVLITVFTVQDHQANKRLIDETAKAIRPPGE